MIPKTTIIQKNYMMASLFRTYTTTNSHNHIMMIGSQQRQQKQYHEPKRRNNNNSNHNNIIIRHHYSYPNGPGKFGDADTIGHKIEHTHDHVHHNHEHHHHKNNDNRYNEYQNDTSTYLVDITSTTKHVFFKLFQYVSIFKQV